MILTYARVSTLEQDKPGTSSMAEQERKCRGVAMALGAKPFDIADYSDPSVSGSIPLRNRPAGSQIFADAKSGDTIITAKLDRLFRSASDALVTVEELQKRGVNVILADIGLEPVTSNGTAKLLFSILSTFAEFERSRIAERMTEGRAAKRARGGPLGRAPFGFKIIGKGPASTLVPDEREQEVLSIVKELTGRYERRRISRHLRKKGYVSRSGKPFGPTQVQRLMDRIQLNG